MPYSTTPQSHLLEKGIRFLSKISTPSQSLLVYSTYLLLVSFFILLKKCQNKGMHVQNGLESLTMGGQEGRKFSLQTFQVCLIKVITKKAYHQIYFTITRSTFIQIQVKLLARELCLSDLLYTSIKTKEHHQSD